MNPSGQSQSVWDLTQVSILFTSQRKGVLTSHPLSKHFMISSTHSFLFGQRILLVPEQVNAFNSNLTSSPYLSFPINKLNK